MKEISVAIVFGSGAICIAIGMGQQFSAVVLGLSVMFMSPWITEVLK